MMNHHGDLAVGISGEDAGLIKAVQIREPWCRSSFVGTRPIDPRVITASSDSGFIPVIARWRGCGWSGLQHQRRSCSRAIASSLRAPSDLLTDVEGLYEDFGDKGSLLSRVSVRDLRAMLDSGKFSEGMIPKVRGCVKQCPGIETAHILDGRVEHALLLEIFTDAGVGTMVTA